MDNPVKSPPPLRNGNVIRSRAENSTRSKERKRMDIASRASLDSHNRIEGGARRNRSEFANISHRARLRGV